MSREKNLLKNTIIISLGKICTQMISFLLLPLYTSVLSTKEYGIVDLLNTLISLLLPIVTLQIEQDVFRELIDSRNKEEKITTIISTGFYSICIQCILFLIIFFIISPFIHNEYKYLLVINVIVYIFSSFTLQITRGLGNNINYTISSFISATVTIIFNILFLIVYKYGVRGMLFATIIGQLICIIFNVITVKIHRYLNYKEITKQILLKMLKYSIPLIPNAISWWIFNASDRVIISSNLGVAMNGIFSAAHKFPAIFITIYNIFNITWTETISLHINDKDAKDFINDMINTIIKLFTSMAIIIIAIMPYIYPIMINKDYAIGYYQIPIMMISCIFNVIVGLISAIYVAKKNTKAIANTSIISAIINIITHLLLIRYIGLTAATISTLIAFLTMTLYRLHDLKNKYFEIKIDKKNLLYSIITLIPITIIYYYGNNILYFLGILISIIYSYFINKQNIQKVINFILKRK